MHPLIGSYVHHNKEKAAIVILGFQTDFAAHTKEAIDATNRLAMLACGFEASVNKVILDNGGQEILDDLSKQLKENIEIIFIEYFDGHKLIEIEKN